MDIEEKMSCVDINSELDSDNTALHLSNEETGEVCSGGILDSEDNGQESEDEDSASFAGKEEVKVSKSQLRKMKRQEKWLARKDEKRAKERLKKKQRRREAQERGEAVGPTRKKLKGNTMAKSLCKVQVVIDCSLDNYMSEKDIMKLVKQIQFCYSVNRRVDNPLQFYVSGVRGQTKERLEAIGDFKNWDVNFTEQDYTQIFDHSKIVYLSSESPNVLHDLDPETAYIIGGLVDHNHHKGLCHQKAVEKNITHAQLPLSEYIDLKSRKVLTINHVFEILLHYTECKDWQKSFHMVLPQRKGVKLKESSDSIVSDQSKCEKTLHNGVMICDTESLSDDCGKEVNVKIDKVNSENSDVSELKEGQESDTFDHQRTSDSESKTENLDNIIPDLETQNETK